jgi:hypothetical protein
MEKEEWALEPARFQEAELGKSILHEKPSQGARAGVVEARDLSAKLLCYRQMQVGKRSSFFESEVLPCLHSSLAFAEQDKREVFFDVAIAIFHLAAVEHNAMVE